jgi:hypothetical protein
MRAGPEIGHLARFLVAGLLVSVGQYSPTSAVLEAERMWRLTREPDDDPT